jgi:hypothetical protein
LTGGFLLLLALFFSGLNYKRIEVERLRICAIRIRKKKETLSKRYYLLDSGFFFNLQF